MKLRSGKIIDSTLTISKRLKKSKNMINTNMEKQTEINSTREIITFLIIFGSTLLLGNIFGFGNTVSNFLNNQQYSLYHDI
jgi:hypothetical protein